LRALELREHRHVPIAEHFEQPHPLEIGLREVEALALTVDVASVERTIARAIRDLSP
jgi:DNA-directed RNA polymerase subunit K/omega